MDWVRWGRGLFPTRSRGESLGTAQPQREAAFAERKRQREGASYRTEADNFIIDHVEGSAHCANTTDKRRGRDHYLVDDDIVDVNELANCTLANVLYVKDNAQNVENLLEKNEQIVMLRIGRGRTYPFCNLPTAAHQKLRKQITRVQFDDDVTAVPERWFRGFVNLTRVALSKVTLSIGAEAFYECTALVGINFGNKLTTIGTRAFCASGLEQLNLRSTHVTELADQVCYGCTKLDKTVFPEGLTSIGNGCFENCASLTRVLLPNSTVTVKRDAFKGCTTLAVVRMQPNASLWLTNFDLADVFLGSMESVTFMSGGPRNVQSSRNYHRLVANFITKSNAQNKFTAILRAVWVGIEHNLLPHTSGLRDFGAELRFLKGRLLYLFDEKLFLDHVPVGYYVPRAAKPQGLTVAGRTSQRARTLKAAMARKAQGN